MPTEIAQAHKTHEPQAPWHVLAKRLLRLMNPNAGRRQCWPHTHRAHDTHWLAILHALYISSLKNSCAHTR